MNNLSKFTQTPEKYLSIQEISVSPLPSNKRIQGRQTKKEEQIRQEQQEKQQAQERQKQQQAQQQAVNVRKDGFNFPNEHFDILPFCGDEHCAFNR